MNVRWSLNLLEKIKCALKGRVGLIAACIAVAVGLLLVFSSSLAEEPETTSEEDLSEYGRALEADVADMCSRIAGVGEARVMITFERGEERTYKGSQIIETKPPRVLGVSVLCEGGGGDRVRAEVTEMLCALFDIGANRVSVLPLKK